MTLEWKPAFVAYFEDLEITVITHKDGGWFLVVVDKTGELQAYSDLYDTEEAIKQAATMWLSDFKSQKQNEMKGSGVYFIKSISGHTKIGCSSKIENRLKTFEVKLPFEVEPHHFISTPYYTELEKWFKTRYAAKRVNGEWFNLSESDLTWIRQQNSAGSLLVKNPTTQDSFFVKTSPEPFNLQLFL